MDGVKEQDVKRYSNPILISILLVVFFPLGLFMLWKKSKWNDKSKTALSIVFGVLAVFSTLVIFSFTGAPAINKLTLEYTKLNMDIEDTKVVKVGVLPGDSNFENIQFISDNNDIVSFEKSDSEESSILSGIVKPKSEGEVNIYVKSKNGSVKSNIITVTIVDNKRIAAEKKAEEELERKKLEEIEKNLKAEAKRIEEEAKSNEEKAKQEEVRVKQEQAKAKQQVQSKPVTNNASTSNKSTSNNQVTSERTIYVTRTGKKYHYSGSCNGGTYYKSTLQQALARKLGPCGKCVL